MWLGAAGLLSACAPSRLRLPPAAGFPPADWSLSARERRTLQGSSDLALVVQGPKGAVLRRRCQPVPPALDLQGLSGRMERAMRKAGGVGLAGPQVGLSLRVATLMLDYKTRHPRVVFVRNPIISERSDGTIEGYEGCLSIPGVGGLVRRNRWIRIQHTASDGQVLSTTAQDHNAVLWQHELDHLDGVLYTDRLLGALLPMEEVRRRREQQRRGPASSPTSWLLDDEASLRL